MKFKLTMLAMLAAIATEASADTLLLNCKITKAEGGNPYEWFANPPTNEADLAQALWNSGLVVFASPPPHRWQIDLQTGDFREPGAKLAYWKPAQIDQENIFASYRPLDGSRTLLMYNRQSHTMRIVKRLSYEAQNAWADQHGHPFPFELVYEYQCSQSAE